MVWHSTACARLQSPLTVIVSNEEDHRAVPFYIPETSETCAVLCCLCSMNWNEEVWREHSDGERLRWLKMSMLTFTPLLHLSIIEQFLFPCQPEDAAVIQLRYISRRFIESANFSFNYIFLKSWCVAGSSLSTPVSTSLSWCYQIQLLASQPAGNSAKFQVFECCVGQSATLYSTCDIMSEACIWRQKQNAFTASAMWPSGHTDVSEGVSPYTLAVVCPCRSAEPRSHSCWSGWLWSSASPGPAADWDTNTAQRLLANAQWNPHVSYNTRCSHGFGCCCSDWLKRTYSLRCGIEVRRLVFWTILAWFLRLIWMTDGASLQGSPST